MTGIAKDAEQLNLYRAQTAFTRLKGLQQLTSGATKHGWESQEAMVKRMDGLEKSIYKAVEGGTTTPQFQELIDAGAANMVLDHSARILKTNPNMTNQQAIDTGTELAAIMWAAQQPEPTSLWRDMLGLKKEDPTPETLQDALAAISYKDDETGIRVMSLPGSGKAFVAPEGIFFDEGVPVVNFSDYTPMPGGALYNQIVAGLGGGTPRVDVDLSGSKRLSRGPGDQGGGVVGQAGVATGGIPTGGTTRLPHPGTKPPPAEAPAGPTSTRPAITTDGADPTQLSIEGYEQPGAAAPIWQAVPTGQQPGGAIPTPGAQTTRGERMVQDVQSFVKGRSQQQIAAANAAADRVINHITKNRSTRGLSPADLQLAIQSPNLSEQDRATLQAWISRHGTQ